MTTTLVEKFLVVFDLGSSLDFRSSNSVHDEIAYLGPHGPGLHEHQNENNEETSVVGRRWTVHGVSRLLTSRRRGSMECSGEHSLAGVGSREDGWLLEEWKVTLRASNPAASLEKTTAENQAKPVPSLSSHSSVVLEGRHQKSAPMSLTELNDDTVRRMAVGAIFTDFAGKITSVDFHRTQDLLVTASEDDSVRLFNIATATPMKTTYHKKHGADRVCFTHHPSSVICSSKYNIDSTGETLRYLSMYDNRCLRYFKGHKDRVISLCMSPINDSFMSGSLDHSVRLWDLRVNACQGILRLRGRPTCAYDQQGLVFAVAMEGGAIKLFDSRSYDKGPFDTFLVGGDTAEVCDIKFNNDGKSILLTTTNNHIYVLDACGGEKRCGFSVEPSLNSTIEATFTPDGQYVVSGSGNGTLHAWCISRRIEVACWNSNIGLPSCLKWAPRRAMFVTASESLAFWIPNYNIGASAANVEANTRV